MSKPVLRVLFVVASAAAAWLAICQHDRVVPWLRASDASRTVLSAVTVMGSVWLALAIHELGHALAGRTQGFVFKFLAVGPLWVERSSEGRYSVRLNRVPLLWGGSSRSFPNDTGNLIRRYAVVVAEGPIASALLALVGWAVGPCCRAEAAHLFVLSLSMSSLLVFVGTAQPFGAGLGLSSDGGALRRLWGGGEVAARDAAILALAGAAIAGVRPRDWPADSVGRSLVPSDGSLSELVALAMAATHAGDKGERDRATALVSRAWEIGERRPHLLGGVAAHLLRVAVLREDAAQARQALTHLRGALVDDYVKLWAEAEVAALDGRLDELRGRARAAIAAVERAKLVKPGAYDRERMRWLADGDAALGRPVDHFPEHLTS